MAPTLVRSETRPAPGRSSGGSSGAGGGAQLPPAAGAEPRVRGGAAQALQKVAFLTEEGPPVLRQGWMEKKKVFQSCSICPMVSSHPFWASPKRNHPFWGWVHHFTPKGQPKGNHHESWCLVHHFTPGRGVPLGFSPRNSFDTVLQLEQGNRVSVWPEFIMESLIGPPEKHRSNTKAGGQTP